MNRTFAFLAVTIWPLFSHYAALADDVSAGPSGINARNLPNPAGGSLNGAGVRVGQVESFRPAKPNFDPVSHPDVVPVHVAIRDMVPLPGQDVLNHSERVAGVIIANGMNHKGIAPLAGLYASSADPRPAPLNQQDYAITFQYLAQQHQVDLINFSAGIPLPQGTMHNGSSLISQFVDWSARVHNVLYVMAADQALPGRPAIIGIPQDSFNRINVGFTEKPPLDPAFRRVSDPNVFTVSADGRRLIDLVAPGKDVMTPVLGGGYNAQESGTSLAVPHVVGTAALLHQYDAAIDAIDPNWQSLYDFGPQDQHLITKVVLMNSADKKLGSLGMDKTIERTDLRDWVSQRAHEVGMGIAGTRFRSTASWVPDKLTPRELLSNSHLAMFPAQTRSRASRLSCHLSVGPTGKLLAFLT